MAPRTRSLAVLAFALGCAALMVLGLTFALGMLVGRQWARQMAPAVAAESGRRAIVARRATIA